MSRTYDTVLVIGAEKLSSIVNWTDRNTCVLFGDGAGAAILQNRANSHGLLDRRDGRGRRTKRICFSCPAAAAVVRPRRNPSPRGLHYLRMDGKETFKNAVQAMHIGGDGSVAPLRN